MLSISFVKAVLVPVLIVISVFDVVLFLVIFGKNENFQINRELEDEEQASYLREFAKNKKSKKSMH